MRKNDATLNSMKEPRSWREMLDTKLIINSAAQEQIIPITGLIELSVPTKKPRWLIPPISWVVHPPKFRIIKLDSIGTKLWGLCKNEPTVETVTECFAELYKLSFHESRLLITNYVKRLVQRGVLVLVQ